MARSLLNALYEGVRAVENLVHPPGTPAPPSRSKLERQQAGE